MLEIYNEEYYDLLAPGSGGDGAAAAAEPKTKHAVAHDAKTGLTTVSGLTLVDVDSQQALEALAAHAMAARAVSAGGAEPSARSSRSHAVFTLRVDGTNAATGAEARGVLNLVDLAGSERVAAGGDEAAEGSGPDRSLAALGDVIFALANKDKHVPFKSSKLTYLLQPCLGGDAKALMLVSVLPEAAAAGESLATLRFAAKVNACEIGVARRNVKGG